MTPERTFRTRFRRKSTLRREIRAGGSFSYVIAAIARPPASFSRRKALLVRSGVGNQGSGVISTPEGPSRTEWSREPRLRRRFLAGGPVSYGIPSEARLRRHFDAGGRVSAALSPKIASSAPVSRRSTCSRVFLAQKSPSGAMEHHGTPKGQRARRSQPRERPQAPTPARTLRCRAGSTCRAGR